MTAQSRALAAVRDGVVVVVVGLGAAFVLTGIASVVYRPRGHVGSPLDWARIAADLLGMAVGAPLRVHTGADTGRLRLVPLVVTIVLVLVARRLVARRGAATARAGVAICALTAAVTVGLLCAVAGSRLTSYGHGLLVHFSVPPLTAAVGAALVVGFSYGLAGRLRGAWARALDGALAGAAVVGTVGAISAVGVLAWNFPASTLGVVPGLLGDGAAWLGGFSIGGRLEANLSSPIPFLSGDLGAGLITGGAWPGAYALVVVPFVAAVVAGRRQLRGAAADVAPWAEFGRAAVVNAALWLALAELTRLRFSGHLGVDRLSGSAGLDAASTVFVAALWGGVSAVVGLALVPVREVRRR